MFLKVLLGSPKKNPNKALTWPCFGTALSLVHAPGAGRECEGIQTWNDCLLSCGDEENVLDVTEVYCTVYYLL